MEADSSSTKLDKTIRPLVRGIRCKRIPRRSPRLPGFKRLEEIITIVISQYRRRLRYRNYRSSTVYTAYVTAVLAGV